MRWDHLKIVSISIFVAAMPFCVASSRGERNKISDVELEVLSYSIFWQKYFLKPDPNFLNMLRHLVPSLQLNSFTQLLYVNHCCGL